MRLKRWLLFLLLPVLFVLGTSLASAEEGTLLKNAITDIKIWDFNNGREATVINGAYQMTEGGKYRYELGFDLSAYNGQLKDGDRFTFTVPNGATIADGTTFTLTDQETGVQLGSARMTSNGAGKGGVITVTIQNLAEYYAKSSASDVKGSFFFEFEAAAVGANQDWSYNPEETQGSISHSVTIIQRRQSAFSTAGENYAKVGGVIAKRPYSSAVLGKSGDYSHTWTMRINTQQKNYNSPIVIKDTIPDSSAPMQFVPEEIVLRQGAYTNSLSSISNARVLRQGVDYTVDYNDSYTEFTLTIPNPGNAAFMLTYMTTSPADGSLVANTARMEVDGQDLPFRDDRPTQTSTYVERSSRITEGGVITADISNSLVLYKQDAATGQVLPGAVFKLTLPTGEEIVLDETDENGRTSTRTFTSAEIAAGSFTVEEVKAPNGYIRDSAPFQVEIKSTGTVRTVKNQKDPNPKISLEITKIWQDGQNQDGKRPSAVTVDVYANGSKLTDKSLTLTGSGTANQWTGQVADLPTLDDNGQPISYTIGEEQAAGYDAPVINQTTRTITNSRTPETLDIQLTKSWEDDSNRDGKRPDQVTVKLYKEVNAQKSEVADKELTEAGGWSASFGSLPKYEAGQEILYSVEEEAVAGYRSQVSGTAADGFTITNSYTPETVSVSGTKTWDDADNQDGKRPDQVTVNLIKDVAGTTETVASKVVSASDNWEYRFDNLPAYEKGQKITYSVGENAVAGYTAKVDGYNLTNTYTPETVKISGSKTWEDADNQDGKRPATIKVKVQDGTTVVDEIEVTADKNWQYESKTLPKYRSGREIAYTVSEEPVAGYTAKVDGYNLTNTYTPEMTTISGTKTWDDADNQDGKRPDQVTVNLLADGQLIKSQTVSQASGWSYSFADLPVYKNGSRISYTVSEEAVTAYSTTWDGYNLTNSYTPEVTEITAQKNWNDNDNQDGKRPAEITIHLVKTVNGNTSQVASKTITAADGWQASFTNLPVYEAGQKISYAVEEEEVAGYSKEIKDFTITNSYTPKRIAFEVSKVWDDANNQDGKRPTSITVQLYQSVNGGEAQPVAGKTLTLTAADQTDANIWKASFTDLPQFDKGEEIVYSVKEDDQTIKELNEKGYTPSVNGQTITNSYEPEKIKISGQKIWDDANNQDGKRPSSIKVKVMKGDQVADEMTVTAANDWNFESKELDKYADGQEISYTVVEEGIGDYTASQSKAADGSYTLTNSYEPAKTSVKGTAIWSDVENVDGLRPSQITVRLLAEGAEVRTAVLSAANGWQFDFSDLPRYKDGKEITYTITTDPIEGYQTEIQGTQIISVHIPKPKGSEEVPPKPTEDPSGKGGQSGSGAGGAGSTDRRVLPKTGEEDRNLLLSGFLLILVTNLLLLLKRKAA